MAERGMADWIAAMVVTPDTATERRQESAVVRLRSNGAVGADFLYALIARLADPSAWLGEGEIG